MLSLLSENIYGDTKHKIVFLGLINTVMFAVHR